MSLKSRAQVCRQFQKVRAHQQEIQRVARLSNTKTGGAMSEENKAGEPITEPVDVQDALDTIRSIEFMGFALEETAFKPKFFESIQKSMKILRHIHDDLVSRLPAEVIEAERAKAMPKPPAQGPKIITPDTQTAGAA